MYRLYDVRGVCRTADGANIRAFLPETRPDQFSIGNCPRQNLNLRSRGYCPQYCQVSHDEHRLFHEKGPSEKEMGLSRIEGSTILDVLWKAKSPLFSMVWGLPSVPKRSGKF